MRSNLSARLERHEQIQSAEGIRVRVLTPPSSLCLLLVGVCLSVLMWLLSLIVLCDVFAWFVARRMRFAQQRKLLFNAFCVTQGGTQVLFMVQQHWAFFLNAVTSRCSRRRVRKNHARPSTISSRCHLWYQNQGYDFGCELIQ